MTKLTVELEGDAYVEAIATANRFVDEMIDRLAKIERTLEESLNTLDQIELAIDDLKKAKKVLDD
tara:strand:- start:24 stop:218 length:195 start_codon:yes stop_codon:yes gene_type:complete